MRYSPRILALAIVVGVVWQAFGADWPMWRYDANRSAASPEELPARTGNATLMFDYQTSKSNIKDASPRCAAVKWTMGRWHSPREPQDHMVDIEGERDWRGHCELTIQGATVTSRSVESGVRTGECPRLLTIPWNLIAGLRNRIVHEYFGLDLEVIWRIVQDDVPALLPQMRTLDL